VRGEVAALPLAGIIDLDVERARLTKEMAKLDQDIATVDQEARQSRLHGARARRNRR
jgi:valyl-tRNA synthetase